MGVIQIYYKNGKQKNLTTIQTFQKGSWIYVEKPTVEELDELVEKLDLEKGHLRDALDINEVPRLEQENNATYIFTRFAYTENNRIETAPLLTIIKKNFFITLLPLPFQRLEKLHETNKFGTTTNHAKLLISIFSQTMKSYNDYLNIISKKVRLSTTNLEKIKNRDIIQFVQYESVLNDFILALVRTNTVVHSFLPGKILSVSDDEYDLLEDISLYNGQLIQISNENLKTIVNIREAYSTIMTNNLNQIIKLFTSLTVVLTIPTIVSSFYGMNVNLPFDNHPYAFFMIFGITMAIVICIIVLFNKKNWL